VDSIFAFMTEIHTAFKNLWPFFMDLFRGEIDNEGIINILGFVAGLFTTASFIPQAIKVIITKDTHSISLCMYVIFCIGVTLWGILGVMIDNIWMPFWNVLTLSFASIVLFYKLHNSLQGLKK
jgi:MtN3 and saliva related transmembrane protein